jgi:hypothetical protein
LSRWLIGLLSTYKALFPLTGIMPASYHQQPYNLYSSIPPPPVPTPGCNFLALQISSTLNKRHADCAAIR